MHLVVFGVNHITAPLSLRERLAIAEDGLPDALAGLAACERVAESAILSTCNRSEFYVCANSRGDDAAITNWISDRFGVPTAAIRGHLYSIAGHKAAEHLFRVAAGLESMVVGESQILHQIKDAYACACSGGATGAILNALFQQAISVGKRVRTETRIGHGAFSIGSVAADLAESSLGRLQERTALIVGAGRMGELAATHLASAGTGSILIANRTHDAAVKLADRLGGTALPFDAIGEGVRSADVVVASTGADRPILHRPMVAGAMESRTDRPLVIIDLAVPRDVDPDVRMIPGVRLCDLDDLQSTVDSAARMRSDEVAQAEGIVREEVARFTEWFRALDATPVITALRSRFEEIRQGELARLRSKLPDLTDEEFQEVAAATRSIVNRICHQPMLRIREYAAEPDPQTKLDTICEAFGICPSEDDAR